MKSLMLDIIKGMLIGVAGVIPGVSGGTMAISTGVYERILDAINNLSKDFKNSFKTLLPLIIGGALGIAGLTFLITFLLEKYPVPTTTGFIGLVLGGVPALYKKIKDEKIKWTHIVSFIITLVVIILSSLLAVNTAAIETVEINLINIFIIAMLGVICSAAMVIPGISGSMLLMMMGYYKFIMELVKSTISNLVSFSIAELAINLKLIIPFAFGAIVGVILISKIISYVIKKWPNASTWGILGLVVASPFAIIVKTGTVTISPLIAIISIVTFILGYLLSSKLGDKE